MLRSQTLRFLAVLGALGAVLLLAGCGVPRVQPTPTPQPLDLVVLHTNDVMGYTEPCG
jgi:nitrous oxide reductase accessory protein NosL